MNLDEFFCKFFETFVRTLHFNFTRQTLLGQLQIFFFIFLYLIIYLLFIYLFYL